MGTRCLTAKLGLQFQEPTGRGADFPLRWESTVGRALGMLILRPHLQHQENHLILTALSYAFLKKLLQILVCPFLEFCYYCPVCKSLRCTWQLLKSGNHASSTDWLIMDSEFLQALPACGSNRVTDLYFPHICPQLLPWDPVLQLSAPWVFLGGSKRHLSGAQARAHQLSRPATMWHTPFLSSFPALAPCRHQCPPLGTTAASTGYHRVH